MLSSSWLVLLAKGEEQEEGGEREEKEDGEEQEEVPLGEDGAAQAAELMAEKKEPLGDGEE